ncbi:hypothetical protein [Streptomyces sp. NPDC051662]|uniref:hypothetical protein n=1 Tax=Streptomyces sp. NPDC051662 TaxID=3154750 RepID=UPI00343046A0
MFIRGKNTRGRTATTLIALSAGLLLTTTACADSKKADPQERTFAFSGKQLNVRTNDTRPTWSPPTSRTSASPCGSTRAPRSVAPTSPGS